MNIKELFAVFSLLLLFANNMDARKDLGEYWRGVTKNQDMPESIQGLLHVDSASTVSDAKANCHTSEDFDHKTEKPFVRESEDSVNILVYHNDIKPAEYKPFAKDIESGPDATIYHNDIKPAEEKSFVKDFVSGPDVAIYHNDIEPTKQNPFVNNFESSPDATIYHNDIEPTKQKSFVNKFEPRPDATIYHE